MDSIALQTVKDLLAQGKSHEEIHTTLAAKGIPEHDISEVLTILAPSAEPSLQPSPVNTADIPTPNQTANPSSNVGKSFLVAYLLSQFWGIFGVDRFYLGKIGT